MDVSSTEYSLSRKSAVFVAIHVLYSNSCESSANWQHCDCSSNARIALRTLKLMAVESVGTAMLLSVFLYPMCDIFLITVTTLTLALHHGSGNCHQHDNGVTLTLMPLSIAVTLHSTHFLQCCHISVTAVLLCHNNNIYLTQVVYHTTVTLGSLSIAFTQLSH